MNQLTQLSLIINFDKRLSHSTHICKQEDWSDDALNETCGAGNWLITPTADLPSDFSLDTYTVIDGKLARASTEIIVQRLEARRAAEREDIRVARQTRYNSDPIATLYWTWIESGMGADREAWIEAKNAVRAELPYPQISNKWNM